MPTLSQPTQQLIQRYREWYRSLEPKEGIATLHVDEVASVVARFYEKIRGIVDWREEHLLRKSAIESIFRRRVLVGEDASQMGEPFMLELIRGGHFPNDAIPESKIEEVQKSIDKYIFLIRNAPSQQEKQILRLQDWLICIPTFQI